ncbi:acetoacetate--CoA ligase [Rhodohalobacter mucosus]|uniref:Acetoacetate--CoA ligase n=1 Tax=Rhodohalobacter mucosus TaxID=2079485 RepID=A0A316TUD6_9BACT|nr:acetoacetate--CoA ligase [Rhodohalobacter mucosus]PWN06645.1 acetoacetate--CoA ligase [Rhodohalobacter mucosus]
MTQSNTLWKPSERFINESNLKKYERWLEEHRGLSFNSYSELWEWSVEDIAGFWGSLWTYFEIIHHAPYERVLSAEKMPGARWFEGATLNYAEHIFRMKNDERPAIHFRSDTGRVDTISWMELERKVSAVREWLISEGVGKGDRVAAYLPNTPEAMITFYAVSSLGAIWSCCSPDFGVQTVIDRFSQIEPAIFFAAKGYTYGGKRHSRLNEINEIAAGIPSIRKTVIIPAFEDETPHPHSPQIEVWEDILRTPPEELSFTPVEFNDPIWVLYSSGTTGKPKAITHSHGGVLLEHLKYLHFHNDVKAGENFFWYTTTGWMMWNFMQASLLAGATAVLFDGSAGFPNLNVLWKYASELPIHHFGTSAPYLSACMKKGLQPGEEFDLSKLRSIGSTGAPLPPEVFDWVYHSVSGDVWLCSMSGGTDMCTAFVGGCPYEPVKRGRIQQRCLGADLHAYSEEGRKTIGALGEMVIQKPMPSMPIYFWGDDDYGRYKSSYFDTFDGKWRHGDWMKLFEDGSLVIQGRSDATLNRKGIRIGTAEIYAVLNKMKGIKDSLIVNLENNHGADVMPLFVVLDEKTELDEITAEIKENLKSECSPRHVPDYVIRVPAIPYTLSGKKMEVPVKKALLGMEMGKEVSKDAMKNPEAMEVFIRMGKKVPS